MNETAKDSNENHNRLPAEDRRAQEPGAEATESVPTEASPAGPGAALGQLPVTVSVIIGKKSMPLREILELQEGTLLRFPQQVEAPLELRLDSVPRGVGVAVDVGGRYGVRLSQLDALPDGQTEAEDDASAQVPSLDMRQ